MDVDIIKNTQIKQIVAYVESESQVGASYKVTCEGDEWECTCPQSVKRMVECKHIIAVKEVI